MTTLKGRTVLVTGGASGLGRSCGQLAAERGAQVILADNDAERLEATATELGLQWLSCDIGSVESGKNLIAACIQDHGRLDGLVNAAGVMQTKEFLEITPDDFDRIIAVNLRGMFFLVQSAAREMALGPGGSIVNFASTAGRVGRPLSAHYAASKAAVINLTKSAASALAAHNIRVNAVCPGLIETPMIQQIREERAQLGTGTETQVQSRWESAIPMGRLGTPEDVAELTAFLLSDASRYITGEEIGVTGGTNGS
jgi:D-sorbitol dehydrogenase (acceptor)